MSHPDDKRANMQVWLWHHNLVHPLIPKGKMDRLILVTISGWLCGQQWLAVWTTVTGCVNISDWLYEQHCDQWLAMWTTLWPVTGGVDNTDQWQLCERYDQWLAVWTLWPVTGCMNNTMTSDWLCEHCDQWQAVWTTLWAVTGKMACMMFFWLILLVVWL